MPPNDHEDRSSNNLLQFMDLNMRAASAVRRQFAIIAVKSITMVCDAIQ